jgi:thermitase
VHARPGRVLSLFMAVALSVALAVPPGSALGRGPVVAGSTATRGATKRPAFPKGASQRAPSPVPARPKSSAPRSSSARSVVDTAITHSAADAPTVIDPLAPAVLGELVVVLQSSIVATSAERALQGRGATVERVKGDAAALLVKAPGGVSDPVFTQLVRDAPGVAWVQPNYLYHEAEVPNDPRFGEQWGLTTIGAPTAWDTTHGKSAVVVAVVDTGVDSTHPDLVGRIDTANGHDFVNGDASTMDDNGHGTHVSGIIAATMNNHVGGAGVAPGCRILPVKVLNAAGWGDTIGVAAGIRYAADSGARIISLSLAGSADASMQDAVVYAQGKGCLVVAAAGNDGYTDGASYPARYYGVIGVAAVDRTLQHPSFSNSGPGVDIAAPGVDVLSTVLHGGYDSWSGTSMATPFVSGVAALVESLNSTWTASMVMNQVLSTAQDIGPAGKDVFFGYGLVRADRAVVAAPTSEHDDIPGAPLAVSPETGALDSGSNKDKVYGVYVGHGQTLHLSLASSADFDLRLYSSEATTVAGSIGLVAQSQTPSSPETIDYLVPATGYYYVDVRAAAGAGPYTLTWSLTGLSPDNVPGVPLPSAPPAAGTLDARADDVDVYQVHLDVGQQLSVFMSGPSTADFDLWLFGSGATGLHISTPLVKRQSPSSDELLHYAATTSGTYSLAAYAYDGAGPYQLDWSIDPASPDINIPGVPLPRSTVTSEVGGLADTDDVYRVFLQAGQTLDCTLTDLSGADPQPVLYLFDPTATDVDADPWVWPPSSDVSTTSFEYVATSTGYHYVDVYAGGDPGAYRLDWSATQGPDDNIPGVKRASPIHDALGVTTDTDDVYRVYAHAGDWISASLTGSPGATTDFDLYLYSTVATDTRSATPVAKADGSRYPKSVGYKAPSTGTYYLQAHAFAGEGTYTLTWSAKPFATVYRPIAPSRVTHGHLFTVYGYVAPRHTSGYYLVTLRFYRKDWRGAWVYHNSVKARRYAYSSTRSKYRATTSLPHTGSWRVRAVHADAGHATSYSAYDYITVR